MKSLAIWTKNENVKIEDLHINIWKLPYEKDNKYDGFYRVIDFGFKFDLSKLEENDLKFNIFYPQKLKISDVEDLVSKLYDKIESKLISTLFNDNLNLSIDSNEDFAHVTNSETGKEFYTYKIKPSKIKLRNKFNGTELEFKIDLPVNVQKNKLYIRFRIKKDYSNVFSTLDKPSNAFFQSQFSKTELFNFRINEVRDISNEVLEEINSKKFKLAKFEKIHIFYICSAKDEYMFSHKNYEGVRILERSKWESYIEEGILSNKCKMLAYHFKEKSVIEIKENGKYNEGIVLKNNIKYILDYNFLIQTKYELNNRKTIILYLIVLFLITLSFNLVSNFLWENGTNIIKKIYNVLYFIYGVIIVNKINILVILIFIATIGFNLKKLNYYGNYLFKSVYNFFK